MTQTTINIRAVSGYSIRKIYSWALEQGMSSCFVFDFFSNEEVEELTASLSLDDYWIDIDLWVSFTNRISEYFGCSVLKLGCMVNYLPKYDSLQIGLLRTLPISLLSKVVMRHILDTTNKNLLVNIISFDKIEKKIVLEYKPIDSSLHRKEVCEYSMGISIVLLHWKGFCGIETREEECVSEGAVACRHICTWTHQAKIHYFQRLKSLVNVFLKEEKIPLYIWDVIGKKIVAADDLKVLDIED